MSVMVKYKGNTIATLTDTGTKTLKTSGKYCEGDITVENDEEKLKGIIDHSITSIVIPNTIAEIGSYALALCYNLTSVTIPNSVTHIRSYAFYRNYQLSGIVIPDSVTSIGIWAFYGCDASTSVTIGNSVIDIGGQAFSHSSNSLAKATYTVRATTPPTITTNTFAPNNIKKIIVPAGCGDAYKTATNWAALADYIEEATA